MDLSERMTEVEAELHDSVLPQLRTMTAAIDALVLRSRPSWFSKAMQTPTAWVAAFGFLTAGLSFTWKTVGEMQEAARSANDVKQVVPIISQNFEQLAGAMDNICIAVARVHEYQLSGRSNGSVTCTRTVVAPLVPPVR